MHLKSELLYQYLFQFHQLPMPGFGLMTLKKMPAQLNIIEKNIQPGFFVPEFHQDNAGSDQHLISWLADKQQLSVADMVGQLNEYISTLMKKVREEGSVAWGSLGFFQITDQNIFHFEGNYVRPLGMVALNAEKVIKSNAGHEVLVGDKIYSDESIRKILQHETSKGNKSRWMKAAILFLCLLIGIISIIATMNASFLKKHQWQMRIRTTNPPETYIKLTN